MAAAPGAPGAAPAGQHGAAAPGAKAEKAPAGTANVSVTVDQITRPGAVLHPGDEHRGSEVLAVDPDETEHTNVLVMEMRGEHDGSTVAVVWIGERIKDDPGATTGGEP